MSIVQTQTTSFKAELYQAVHNLATDTLKCALYTANASLNADTTVYSSTNEVSGTGYTAGGVAITPSLAIDSSTGIVYIDFSNASWSGALTARCALIYNASKANRAIAILDVGSNKTSTTTFTVTLPPNTAETALIRSSN